MTSVGDNVKRDFPEYAELFVESLCKVFDTYVLPNGMCVEEWIQEQGGWVSMANSN